MIGPEDPEAKSRGMVDGAGIIGGYGELGVLVEYISVTWWKLVGCCDWTSVGPPRYSEVGTLQFTRRCETELRRGRRKGNPRALPGCA